MGKRSHLQIVGHRRDAVSDPPFAGGGKLRVWHVRQRREQGNDPDLLRAGHCFIRKLLQGPGMYLGKWSAPGPA